MEELSSGDPRHVAAENARRKALAITNPHTPLVLGADTDVALDGDILGKPADAAQARAFLERLSGRTHDVVGGIALAQDGRVVAEAVVVTPVRFRALDPGLIDWYVADRRVARPGRRLRDPGPGRRARGGRRRGLLQRRRAPLATLLWSCCPELLPAARLQ